MNSRSWSIRAAIAALITLTFGVGLGATQLAPASAASAAPLPITCADVPVEPGQMTCFSEVQQVPTRTSAGTVRPMYTGMAPSGITAADIQSMYGLPPGAGAGTTVAVIDAGSAPQLETDLATYRSAMGLAACTKANGCLTEISQTGSTTLPALQPGWDFETTMDVEAVSAACPACRILVVDAKSSYNSDLRQAVSTAVSRGARYVSMSYGSPDTGGASSFSRDEAVFATPGVTFVASSGDEGYAQVATSDNDGITCGQQYVGSSCASYPSSSPHVVSAGGTSVDQVNGAWVPTTWSGSTSGCSNSFSQPAFQRAVASIAAACPQTRASSDVSALADPDSGMLIYQGGDWYFGGGTSLSAPLLTAMYAEAGNHTDPFNLYAWASAQYDGAGAAAFTDVTTGSSTNCDGTILCRAAVGWDGATGVGSPYGLAGLSTGAPTVTAPTPDPVTTTITAVTPDPGTTTTTPDPGTGTGATDGGSTDGDIGTTPTPTPTPVPTTGSAGGSSGTTGTTPVVSPPGPLLPGRTVHHVKGKAHVGKKVSAAYGPFRSATGATVKAKVRITWYVNGRPVTHRASIRIKKTWRGKRLSYRVTATAPGYRPLTFTSASVKVR